MNGVKARLAITAFAAALAQASLLMAAPVEVPEAVRQAEDARIAVMQKVAPSVVAIFAAGGQREARAF